MAYTFSASGLPPGLSLVGNVVSGTPTTPGTYTVTFTVADGVSSVSEVVSVTIAPVTAPVPFWQLILDSEAGSYAKESVLAIPQILVPGASGSYAKDTFYAVGEAEAESVVYWRDDAAVLDTSLLQATWQECYVSGKGSFCVNRGNWTWRSDTTPENSGSLATFVQCDGSTLTLVATYGGTLSQLGVATNTGACP